MQIKKIAIIIVTGCLISLIGQKFASNIGETTVLKEALVRKIKEEIKYMDMVFMKKAYFDEDEKNRLTSESLTKIKADLMLISRLDDSNIFRKPILVSGLIGTALFAFGFCIGQRQK